MGMLFQAAAGAAFTFALAVGSPGYQGAAVASIWPTLSNDQREFIELVAEDIHEEQGVGEWVDYDRLDPGRKNVLRAKAMDRLGFVVRPPRGVEV